MKSNDWHPADIIAALHKKNKTLARISREANLSSSTLSNALYRPWPKGEIIIASAIGVDPSIIWPSRYFDADGKPIPRNFKPRKNKSNE
ncbi:helix-turn-helix domain-containing protein [Salmonella enterica]